MIIDPHLRALLERVVDNTDRVLGWTSSAYYQECRDAIDELKATMSFPEHRVCTNGILCQNRECEMCAGNGAVKVSLAPVAWTDPITIGFLEKRRSITNEAWRLNLMSNQSEGFDVPMYLEPPVPITHPDWEFLDPKREKDRKYHGDGTHQRRVVASAIRYGEVVVPSARHYSPLGYYLKRALHMGGVIPMNVAGEQGFIDQWDEFMTREVAMDVAINAGQVDHPGLTPISGRRLFSENVW